MFNDPRGPLVTVTEVMGFGEGGWRLLRKSCGHIGEHAPHFYFKEGEEIRCMECKQK